MAKLFLLRHLKSRWNEENRFSGWTDVPISEDGRKDAAKRAKKIFETRIDEIFTSSLFRNIDTAVRVLKVGKQKYPIFISRDGGKNQRWGDYFKGPKNYTPVYTTWRLNERHYGSLEGLNKKEMIAKYGEEKVHLWRRSYKVSPPGGGESMKTVSRRMIPFYKKYIEKDLKKGKNILIIGSHNPLRVLVKYLERISDKDIVNVEIDYGSLLEYDINKSGLPKKKFFDKI